MRRDNWQARLVPFPAARDRTAGKSSVEWMDYCSFGVGVADKTSGVDVREDDREQAVSSFSHVIFFDEAEHDEKNVFGKQNPQ